MPTFGSKSSQRNRRSLRKDAKKHYSFRVVAAAGGVDWLLRRREKMEDKKDPSKNHDHKARDAAIVGGVGLALHEHDKHKREKAQKEEAARAELARAANVQSQNAPVANTNAAVDKKGMAGPNAAATGAGVTGAGAAYGSGPSSHRQDPGRPRERWIHSLEVLSVTTA